MQIPVFLNFFEKTGTSMDSILGKFTATGYMVTAICGIAVLILAHYLLKKLAIYNKVKATLSGLWQGSHLAERREKRTALHRLYPGHLAELFPALLSHLPVLRINQPSQSDVRTGDIHRGQHSGNRTNT